MIEGAPHAITDPVHSLGERAAEFTARLAWQLAQRRLAEQQLRLGVAERDQRRSRAIEL